MLKDLVSHLTSKFALLLYAIAVTLLAIAFAFTGEHTLSARVSLLLESLGYAVAGGTLVASVMNFAFESTTRRAFTIVGETEAARISQIFANRNHALRPIREAIERASTQIDILTVAGTSTLHSHTEAIITALHRRCQGDRGVPARILLLDPRSRFAFERCVREEQLAFPPKDPSSFNYHQKKLCSDIVYSLRQLEGALGANPRSTIRARLCNAAPMLMYIRMDDEIFVEQYHYGVPPDQTANPFTKCLGKAVPVLRVDGPSEIGTVLRSHFEYMWDRSDKRDVGIGTAEYVQHHLETGKWGEFYSAESQAEDGRLDLPPTGVACAPVRGDA